MEKILIIGGGPAGMMAAISAARESREVVLFEKNDQLGKKLLLTGKGRCNLTNMCEPEAFLDRFLKNGKFLRDALKHFSNRELVSFFETRGLALKVERQQRVFPETDKSSSVLNVLIRELKKKNVSVHYQSVVKNILVKNGKARGVICSKGQKYDADKIIVATGGFSYPQTGSTGDGYRMSEQLGHTIVPLMPALVALETQTTFTRQLMGLTLKNIRLIFCSGKKKIVSEIGELLFTDFGVSGPLVLSLSGQVGEMLKKGKVFLRIDLKPALDGEQIEKRLIREFNDNPRMLIKNLMRKFLPIKLAPLFLDCLSIDLNKDVNHISAQERKKIGRGLKSFSLDVLKLRPIQFAMVTQGGVSLKEVNPKTMESRFISGLYFAGEILDVNGDTGGFNLQAAFSTGFLAGKSA